MKKALTIAASLTVLLLAVWGCSRGSRELAVISGSENETLAPLLEKFLRQSGIRVAMTYKGSVDIMMELQKETPAFDAVWPAHSLWISLGDRARRVKHARSIMTSPVVFAVRRSKAEALGFTGRPVHVRDILAAIRGRKLTFMMTSASQSNSGASAYIGFLSALLGDPDVISMEDLGNPALKKDIRDLLSGINRSSGSSGWLKDLFLGSDYDAMVNYESLVIEANQELVKGGREPLYAIYPVDGMVISDSPLGYINRGKAAKEEKFLKLQAFLLSDETQREIARMGRRTGVAGAMAGADPGVFNPAWGIDTGRILAPIRMPSAEVILRALELYQTDFKKPSYTVFCLDYSESMEGSGVEQLRAAMDLLLSQEKAGRFLLQAGSDDVTVVIPFSGRVIDAWEVRGNDPRAFEELAEKVKTLKPKGSTDIYSPAISGLDAISRAPDRDSYVPAVVLMTDGESNTGRTLADAREAWQAAGIDVPVFSIMFGNASKRQLDALASFTRGRVFDGREDLVGAFRSVKGYN
jgi:Ca-activated chloride channel family protein